MQRYLVWATEKFVKNSYLQAAWDASIAHATGSSARFLGLASALPEYTDPAQRIPLAASGLDYL